MILWGSFWVVCKVIFQHKKFWWVSSEKFLRFHKKSASKTLYLSLRLWWRRWRRCTNKEDDHKWRWRWWTNNNNNNKDDDHKKRGASFFLPQTTTTTTTTTITRRRICRLLQCLHLCRAALFSAVVVPGGAHSFLEKLVESRELDEVNWKPPGHVLRIRDSKGDLIVRAPIDCPLFVFRDRHHKQERGVCVRVWCVLDVGDRDFFRK